MVANLVFLKNLNFGFKSNSTLSQRHESNCSVKSSLKEEGVWSKINSGVEQCRVRWGWKYLGGPVSKTCQLTEKDVKG